MSGFVPPSPAQVWFIQRTVEHYRIPVMDGLVHRGKGRYEISFMGPLIDGMATSGITRPYLRHLDYARYRVFGQELNRWPSASNLIRRLKPNVVVINPSPRNLSAYSLPGACRKAGAIPIFWSKIHSFSGIPSFVMKRVKRRLYGLHDFGICYGRLSYEELIHLGFPADRLVVAQNTIDTRRIFSDRERIVAQGRKLIAAAGLEGRRVILCVGRMDAEKRQDDLIEAWPELSQFDKSLVLVLVGGGQCLEMIKKQAKTVDPQRIVVTGRVPEGDDYAWLAVADVAVSPGAVGLSINQSLAFGTPTVIADEIGADTEIVEHKATGWRYPRGNQTELVKTIQQVLEDRQSTSRITEAGRKMMRERVTIDNMVTAIDQIIGRALALQESKRSES